ncbi:MULTISPECIES: thioredoxin family protein [Flavobacterium]|jgi:peroxiredoxin|uniref:Thioredoxin family protein n=1 Tax=Flavobacterium cupriresistens TaxID=2893885 RepID=A0ABU4RAA5_9FLAO|nr:MULTISPECIES: thioredoxin family protein [unclassified Flavobacterium]KLT69735.1 redoxin [Flavobacterium sp. ABG]MDX6189516.1 thioredoxin family protein [Flavobacterium sp. Fl-318]UFH41075.1 thioredoxin family protein [Flavobacterium sp. F-323]
MKKYITIMLFLTAFLSQAQSKTLKAGETAPDFKLKNVDNKDVSFESFPKAKGFIVVFTCNTCPYAKAYEQRIIDLDKKFKPEGYPVIAINPNDPEASKADTFDKMQDLAKDKKYAFPYLFDKGQLVTDQYGAKHTPHLFVVSKSAKGTFVEYTGAIDNDPEGDKAEKTKYVEDVISALQKNQKPTITETKEIGCTVKRKAKA